MSPPSMTATAPGTTRSVDNVIRRIAEISTLPQVAMQVLEVARNPDSGAADLRRIVECDPALSARVLRMVNSAAFAVRTTVTNLHQAISYIGFTQVRNLALTASVSDLFKTDETIGRYRRSGLWRHLVATGLCARLVAMRCRVDDFEDAFLAGLLHDIGIILADEHDHECFSRAMSSVSDERSLLDAEREHLGYTHTQLGDAVAEAWRFPPITRGAIRYHHGSEGYRGEHEDIVRCVEVANVICTMKGTSSTGFKNITPPLETFRKLNLRREDILVLATDLEREIAGSESLFEL